MQGTSVGFQTQVVSDVVRDGLGIELISPDGSVVAEVFRLDAAHSVSVSLFADAVPLAAIELLLQRARNELGRFEDGTPLSSPSHDD
jgi:hypothetical protein